MRIHKALSCNIPSWLVISLLSLMSLGNFSCVKISNSSLHIPPDVFFAARANILRATYQVPNWKDILREEFSIDVESDSTSRTNFLASGKAYLFGDVTEGENNYIAFAISIRNHRSLQKFVTTLNPELELKSYKRFNYLVKNKSLLAWSHNVLILMDAPQAATEDHLATHFEKIANIRKHESLIKQNENFRVALRNDYDVALWINGGELKHSSTFRAFAENANLDSSYIHIQANFDEGQISTETQFYPHPNLAKSYTDYISRPVDRKLVSHTPIQKPVALVGLALEPDGMRKVLEDLGWLGKAENLAQATTFTLDHFIEMLSGDFVMAIRDISSLDPDSLRSEDQLDDNISLQQKKAKADAVLGMKLKNQAIFDSLTQALEETGILVKKGAYYEFFEELYIMPSDSMVFLTKSTPIKDDFLKGLVLENTEILASTEDNWFILHANEALTKKTIKGQTMLKVIAQNLLRNEDVQLKQARLTVAHTQGKKSGASSLILLQDDLENSLLAMLEVLKEVVSQTKMRLDPNYYSPE